MVENAKRRLSMPIPLPLALVGCLMALLGIVIGAVGVWIGLVNDAQQDADNKLRDEQNAIVIAAQAELLDCINTYATRVSDRTRLLGDARVEVDNADKEFTEALDAVLRYAASAQDEEDPEGVRLFLKLTKATTAKVAAQDEYDRLKDENPVVDAPKTICEEEQ